MDLSNQSGRDALNETRNVLSDLRQFLSIVGSADNSGAKAELKEIENCLGQVVKKIANLNRQKITQQHKSISSLAQPLQLMELEKAQ